MNLRQRLRMAGRVLLLGLVVFCLYANSSSAASGAEKCGSATVKTGPENIFEKIFKTTYFYC